MSRIALVVPANTDPKVAATLSQIKTSRGRVPNFFALFATPLLSTDSCHCQGAFAWPPHGPSTRNPRSGHSPGERVPILPIRPYGIIKAVGLNATDALKVRFEE